MVYTKNIEFVWDPLKAQTNFKKHGVSFEEAVLAFADPFALREDDVKHSVQERRELLIGSIDFNTIIVAFVVRNDGFTYRIISTRRANEKEKRKYRLYRDSKI